MKKFCLILLLISLLSSNDIPKKSTLKLMELKSSKILTDFQGQKLVQFQSHNNMITYTQVVEYKLEEVRSFEIVQVDENTFRVLGSPIEWETK